MAQFVLSTYWVVQLKKTGLLEEQIQALQEILATIFAMLQVKPDRSHIRAPSTLQPLEAIVERLLCSLSDASRCALIRMASESERASGGCAFDVDAFRAQAEALGCVLQWVSAPVTNMTGRISTLDRDLEVIRVIYEAMRLGWERRSAQGLPMPSWDASQPSVSKTRGFCVAIKACLDTIGFTRPLTKARIAFARNYWLRSEETRRRRKPRKGC